MAATRSVRPQLKASFPNCPIVSSSICQASQIPLAAAERTTNPLPLVPNLPGLAAHLQLACLTNSPFFWSRGCIPWLLMRVNWTLVSVAAANRPCHNLPEENKVRNKREGKQLGNLKYEHCQWTYLHSDPQNTPLQEQTLKEIC